LRFRRKGYTTHYFGAKFPTPEFWQEYNGLLAEKPEAKLAKVRAKAERIPSGSMSALIARYYVAPEFTGLADSTKATYRGILERFREDFGDLPVATLTRQGIKEILGGMSSTPSAANNLLDRLRVLMQIAIDDDWRKDDPTLRVKGFRIKSDGFHSWTEAEIAKFEHRHEPGSKARLALALLLYTGQRRSDVVRMGRQMVEGGRINVRQTKTGEWVSIPIHAELRKALASAPKTDMTFLLTEYRKPFTAAGFGNWFRTQCDLAGLPQCSAHGLRKAASRRLAEAGCTHEQIKSITGHKTDKEVSRYVDAANKEILSEQAIRKISGTKRKRAVANRRNSDG
jgi:integrase